MKAMNAMKKTMKAMENDKVDGRLLPVRENGEKKN